MTSWSLWGYKIKQTEDVNNSDSSLSCSRDLGIENPGRCCELTENKSCNTFSKLRELRLENQKNIVISHPNVNSIRNKFTSLKELISCKSDICLLSETTIDKTLPNTHFEIEGYKIFREGRSEHGAGMSYINENIPSRELNTKLT